MSMITGVHHVGIGVNNYELMKSYYQTTLAFEDLFLEIDEEWNAMSEMFRTSTHKFKAVMFAQPAGGVLVELIRMSLPVPRPIRKDIRYGDIGVNKVAIGVRDVFEFYNKMESAIKFCSKPVSVTIPGWRDYQFVYAKDPEGNLVEFVSGSQITTSEKFAGGQWVGVSVSDLDRSIAFYQTHAGFDTMPVAPHDRFSGLVDGVAEAEDTRIQSCILANSNGGGMLELYELAQPRGRSIPFNARWGDFGCLEVCLMCENIHETAQYLYKAGMEFLSQPTLAMETPDYDGWFLYIRDPDGIPLEMIAMMPK